MGGAIPKNVVAAMLAAEVAGLTTPKLGLYTSGITPLPTTPLSAFTAPTGTWYAAATPTFGRPFENPDGSVSMQIIVGQFNYTGASASETVNGWYLWDDGVSPKLLVAAGALPTPVTMAGLLDSVLPDARMTIPSIPQTP